MAGSPHLPSFKDAPAGLSLNCRKYFDNTSLLALIRPQPSCVDSGQCLFRAKGDIGAK
jgi:hypothetical protein